MNALASVGPDRILDLTYAFRRARLLAAAVEFAIFTVLGREGPLGVAALAARCGLHARAARDALDALVALGLLLRDDIDDDRSSAAHALLSSLNMLLATEGGADFSAAECAGWLRGAGFDAGQLIPLAGPFSAMVATRLPESEASRGQRPQH